MPTQKYFLADGSRAPSVTTVLSTVRLGSIEGLLIWANRLGLEGVEYRERLDHLAKAGTIAHAMVESDIRGTDFDRTAYPADAVNLALTSYEAYKRWRHSSNLQVVSAETPLISERHGFGGTLDAVMVGDKLALFDWKTGKHLMLDHKLQLAGYSILWDENNPDWTVKEFHLVRLVRTEDDEPIQFAHHFWSDLTREKALFIKLLDVYNDYKDVKKRL